MPIEARFKPTNPTQTPPDTVIGVTVVLFAFFGTGVATVRTYFKFPPPPHRIIGTLVHPGVTDIGLLSSIRLCWALPAV